MAEFTRTPVQTVTTGNAVVLDTVIGCNRGYVLHREDSGIVTLRGIVNGQNNCFARYQVTFNGNIALPTGGTAGPISVAIAIDGEPTLSSEAIVTPAAVEEFFNVTSTAIITVPAGCCDTISIENTSGVDILVQNANLVVSRIA